MRIPAGITAGMVIGVKGCNIKKLHRISECCVKVDKKNVSRVHIVCVFSGLFYLQVLIITDRKDKLNLLVDEMKLILFQEVIIQLFCYTQML